MIKPFDIQYIELAQKIINEGVEVVGRDSLQYIQIFGQDIMCDLRIDFPILSLRKMPLTNLFLEFLWDIKGNSNINSLGTARHFWEFLSIEGWLPSSYGSAWRRWPQAIPPTSEDSKYSSFRKEPFDQLRWVYNELELNPTNRQLVIQTLNPSHNPKIVKCPPCHPSMVFSSDSVYLDLLILGRSQDLATGLPLDIIRYGLLLKKMAEDNLLIPRFLKITIANAHIYKQNLEAIREIIARKPQGGANISIDKSVPLFKLSSPDQFKVFNYNPHPSLRMEVAK